MNKINTTWKLFASYMLILLLILMSNRANAQIVVTQFNAECNAVNAVDWLD